MIVYRYLESGYVQRFRKEGKIWISTLKRVKSHPNERLRDELEGEFDEKIEPKSKPETFSTKTINEISSAHFTKEAGENPFTVMPNSIATFKERLEDAYVFCTSLAKSKELNERWKYDKVFEITDPFSFADTMYEELSRTESMIGYMMDKICYGFRQRKLTPKNEECVLSKLPYDLCFTKPLRFREEKEWRMVFVPRKAEQVEPHEVTCTKLLKFCHF
jgi:hypothetical protein